MNNYQEKVKVVVDTLGKIKIVPVLVLNSIDEGLKMCEVLMKADLKTAEITFRTEAAESIIKAASKEFPELFIGAGTILNVTDLHRAFDAGAAFAVAPGFNPTVVKEAVKNAFAFAPGICTPSEFEQAHELGCKFVKFFPAEAAGGLSMLNSIIAPYKHLGIRIMPTGGVTPANVETYLKVPEIVCVGGTWLAKAPDLKAGNFDVIEKACLDAVELAKKF